MNITRLAVVGVAVTAGLAAALLARGMLAAPPAVAPTVVTAPAQTVDVLVASRDLAMGSSLGGDDFKWQSWPLDGVPANVIQRTAKPDAAKDLTGSIARDSFVAGEPINDAKLIHSDRGFMSAILPAGKRAVATAISADTSAGGFILPNDHVDVIMTRKADAGGTSNGEKYVTETVLNNVRVLAIDQTIEEKNGEKVVVGQTATLELTASQAQILTVAQQMSQRLTLALRSLADATDTDKADAMHLIQGESGTAGVRLVRNGVTKQIETAQ